MKERGSAGWIQWLLALAVFGIAAGWVLMLFGGNDEVPQGTVSVGRTCTTYGGSVDEQCVEDYIGLSWEEARERGENYGLIVGLISVDGVPQANMEPGGNWVYLQIEQDMVVGACVDSGDWQQCKLKEDTREEVALPEFMLQNECGEMPPSPEDGWKYEDGQSEETQRVVWSEINRLIDEKIGDRWLWPSGPGFTVDSAGYNRVGVTVPAAGKYLTDEHYAVLEEIRDKYLDQVCFFLRDDG